MNKPRTFLTALALLACAWPLAAQTATPAPKALDEQDKVIVLSPFEVTSSKDNGYQATETLAGTRIRTDLKDVASAIQVVTKEFMQDVGATNTGSLLQYTTNAEVAGTRGTYAGLGNATAVDETGNLRNPSGAQRVRGLASADNTRDFFVTDIPWDSFNVDRIDIQRGPNAILFGLGSPAGIINAATHDAEFRNFGSVNATTGSYGTFRSSLDLNQDLIENTLAIRLDGMWDNHKYEQQQAWQNDRRFYGAIKYDPDLFHRRDFHTSIKVKFENGDIKADRPRIIPPYDSITPWFAAADTTSTNGGLGKLVIPNGYTLGASASTYFPWLSGYANQQQPIWFVDGATSQLYRIYGGYVNTGALNAAGVPQGVSTSLIGQRYADTFSDIGSYSSYATNAKLPGYQYGQYRNRVLTDPTVFDFYDNLIDGPTKSEFEKWNATNIDLTQTFWNDRLGVELSYDRQKYKNGGQALIGNPTLNIDILQNFQDYVVGPNNTTNGNVGNPNFGRPFVPVGPGSGNSHETDRKYTRGSVFGELRATDYFAKDSFLAKLIGRHRFNGVFSDEKYYVENRNWQMYANSEAYSAFKLQGNTDGIQNLPPVGVVYLGGSLASAASAANAHVPGITSNVTLQSGNIYQFDETWRSPTGVSFNTPWNVPANLQQIFNGAPVVNPANGAVYPQLTQVSNPANYVGWNSNFVDNVLSYNNGADQSLITAASKSLRETKSYAGSWQGYLWNDAIVPTLGWRYDEVKSKGVSAPLLGGGLSRGAYNLSSNVYALPDAFPANQIFKDHSTSGGVVVHLNQLLESHDFLPFNVSLSYNKSSNFQVTDIRRDIYGNPIANPTGATKEYGVTLSTKDGKYSFHVVKYDTASTGVTVSGFDNSGLYGTIRDAMNWRNIKLYYMSGYAWSTAGQTNLNHFQGVRYEWDPSYVDAAGRPVASGNPTNTNIPAGATLETQAQADSHRDASIAALNSLESFLAGKGYFSAWNYGAGPTTLAALTTPSVYLADPASHQPNTASVYDYRTAPLLQGFGVTSDVHSKGYEFELTANPTPNWRLAFNAAQTIAVRSNVGGPALDGLVSELDSIMAGPGGDLVRFNSEYSASNLLRTEWNSWRGNYTLLKLTQNTAASELRKWRYNFISNYSFTRGLLRGAGVGAGYRWQDKVVIGYPVVPNATNPALASFDLTKPYYGPSEDALDLWVSYERKLTKKINWRIQLNVYNVGKKDKLIPISVEPDGHTWAAARIAPIQEWQLSNTLSF